jgi:uncharacterized membrane-anchored protein YjiN (DUF445 family)
MSNEEIYYGFDKKQQEKYEQELKDRYGKNAEEKIAESKRNMKNWKKADYEDMKAASDELHKEFAAALESSADAQSPEVQQLVRKHYKWVERFYTPSKEIYSSLGDLYVDHPDFRKLYDSYHPQLAEFLRDAMKYFAEREL